MAMVQLLWEIGYWPVSGNGGVMDLPGGSHTQLICSPYIPGIPAFGYLPATGIEAVHYVVRCVTVQLSGVEYPKFSVWIWYGRLDAQGKIFCHPCVRVLHAYSSTACVFWGEGGEGFSTGFWGGSFYRISMFRG